MEGTTTLESYGLLEGATIGLVLRSAIHTLLSEFSGARQPPYAATMSSRLLIWALSIVMIRLRGGGPKKRCGCFISTTERCSSPAVRKLDDTVFPLFVRDTVD
jgi:hypothetical protein